MCTTTAIKVINAKAKCSTRAFYIYTVKRTLQCKFYFFSILYMSVLSETSGHVSVPSTLYCCLSKQILKNCYLQKSIKCPTILQTPSPKVLIRIQAVSSPHSQWKEAWAVARSTDSWRSWFLEIFWWRGSRFSHAPTEGASKNENTEVGKRQNNLNENWSYKPPVTEIGELN